ncbi:hypothetical protein Hanom_Chr17g01591921 [Helianthus anomalus]
MDDVKFPPLRSENFKSNIGKVGISNRFYYEKKEFDVDKVFNGNVKIIFGKMVEGKVKGVKEFYETKKATYTMTESELDKLTSKLAEAWMSVVTCRSFQVGKCEAGIGIFIGKMVWVDELFLHVVHVISLQVIPQGH